MNRKFDMRICKCGHIHMIPIEKVEKALKTDRNLLLICAGCGGATIIGADIEPNLFGDSDGLVYSMYACDFSPHEDASIHIENFGWPGNKKGFSEIFYSHGIHVPMVTGTDATGYFNGKFYDNWYPDFWKIERIDVTVEEIMKFITKWREERITVDMGTFISQTDDDILEELSHYYIPAFNWAGTKFEKKE